MRSSVAWSFVVVLLAPSSTLAERECSTDARCPAERPVCVETDRHGEMNVTWHNLEKRRQCVALVPNAGCPKGFTAAKKDYVRTDRGKVEPFSKDICLPLPRYGSKKLWQACEVHEDCAKESPYCVFLEEGLRCTTMCERGEDPHCPSNFECAQRIAFCHPLVPLLPVQDTPFCADLTKAGAHLRNQGIDIHDEAKAMAWELAAWDKIEACAVPATDWCMRAAIAERLLDVLVDGRRMHAALDRCRGLPPAAQKCSAMSYSLRHADECERVDRETRRR